MQYIEVIKGEKVQKVLMPDTCAKQTTKKGEDMMHPSLNSVVI